MARTYTLNEVIDALHRISKAEDSLSTLLKAGDFRQKFEAHVTANRNKRNAGELSTLQERLVAINYNGDDVYILDDIQSALNKGQFVAFMKFLRTEQVAVDTEETAYIPVKLTELFIQRGEKTLLEDRTSVAGSGDVISVHDEDDPTVLKFA